jgi:hypothetical protein
LVDLGGSRTLEPPLDADPEGIVGPDPADVELAELLLGLKAPGRPSIKLGIFPLSPLGMNGFFFETWSMIDPGPELLSRDVLGARDAGLDFVVCRAFCSVSRVASA